jgi:hypothetical protein
MEEPLVRYRRGHGSMTLDRRSINRYDFHFIRKMLRDTPPDLRWTLPSRFTVAGRWLSRAYMPLWLRQPRKQWAALRPRMQAFRATIAGAVGL